MNRSRFWILSLAGILAAAGATAADVRYVTVDIPKESATLSLAEVEVITKDGKNIARQGAATQSSTANNGVAARAIDGRTDANWGSGTITHSGSSTSSRPCPWTRLSASPCGTAAKASAVA